MKKETKKFDEIERFIRKNCNINLNNSNLEDRLKKIEELYKQDISERKDWYISKVIEFDISGKIEPTDEEKSIFDRVVNGNYKELKKLTAEERQKFSNVVICQRIVQDSGFFKELLLEK